MSVIIRFFFIMKLYIQSSICLKVKLIYFRHLIAKIKSEESDRLQDNYFTCAYFTNARHSKWRGFHFWLNKNTDVFKFLYFYNMVHMCHKNLKDTDKQKCHIAASQRLLLLLLYMYKCMCIYIYIPPGICCI